MKKLSASPPPAGAAEGAGERWREAARGMLGVVVSVCPWRDRWAEHLQVASWLRVQSVPVQEAVREHEAGIRGGKDARETRKKKTRRKGLVQSPSLCSVLWFTGLEHSHPGPSAWGQPSALRPSGWGGLAAQEAVAVRAAGLGAPLFSQ